MKLQEGVLADAVLSSDGAHRYTLTREWDQFSGKVNWVMLNPSTADAEHDDPTIRKCMKFARRWGFGGIYVTNLFAFRTKSPSELTKAVDPIGPDNDAWLKTAVGGSGLTVLGWGGASIAKERAKVVVPMLLEHGAERHANIAVLRQNIDGSPIHPLYVPDNQQLSVVEFE